MAIAISILAIAIVAALCITLQRRPYGAVERDVEHLRPHEGGTHQGRAPGADGGGISYYNGGS